MKALLFILLTVLASPASASATSHHAAHHKPTVKHHKLLPDPFRCKGTASQCDPGGAPVGPTSDSNALFWLAQRPVQPERLPEHLVVASRDALVRLVTNSAVSHGVPPTLARAIIHVESGFRCNARNGHARGIGQVLPQTATSVGIHGNLLDCSTGLEASMRYLKLAVDMHGTGCAAASSYNTGVWTRSRCTAYGRHVMQIASRG